MLTGGIPSGSAGRLQSISISVAVKGKIRVAVAISDMAQIMGYESRFDIERLVLIILITESLNVGG
jgi:hypothetical protein